MCSELHGYNLARLKEKRIKSHKFRVGCVLFFPHPLFSISTFARLGSNPLHFTCPKSSVSSLTCSRVIQSSEQPLLVSYSQAYKSDILTNNNSYIRNSLLYYIRVLVLSTITLIIVIHEDARDMWIIESESRKPKEISCCFSLTFFHHFPPVKKKGFWKHTMPFLSAFLATSFYPPSFYETDGSQESLVFFLHFPLVYFLLGCVELSLSFANWASFWGSRFVAS